MLKKTITFKDLDDNPLTEDFYFNLSKMDLAEMDLNQKGGLVDRLQAIVTAGDSKALFNTFKWIILKAYGERSTDGRRFIKSPLISEEFTQTDAYSVLFMELMSNEEASAIFIRGILPADLVDGMEVAERLDREIVNVPLPEPVEKHPIDMTREELLEAMRKKNEG